MDKVLNVFNARLQESAKLRRRTIKLSFGGMKQVEIAKVMRISRQRVHQILNPKKRKARKKISKRVSLGQMLPARKLKCVDCGKPAKEYDHPDYGKPLIVDPVCLSCHGKRTRLAKPKK